MKTQMRKSNMMLLGAGIFLVLMLLASVITARVAFDRSVTLDGGSRNIVYVETRF